MIYSASAPAQLGGEFCLRHVLAKKAVAVLVLFHVISNRKGRAVPLGTRTALVN
jgi:hypothetical protein